MDVDEHERENVLSGEDWKCGYCDRLNHNWHDRCECGASKDESDAKYFELKAEEEREQDAVEAREYSDEVMRSQSELDNNPMASATDIKERYDNKEVSGLGTTVVRAIHQNWNKLIIALLCIVAVVGLGYVLMPKNVELDVSKVMWQSNIKVDILKTFNESDWSVPTGGRVTSTSSEIRSYIDVPDGTETVTKYRSKTVSDGVMTSTKNLGNGAFQTVTTPKYKTIQEPYTVTQTKYRKEPVWDTKYYYEIDRYVHNRDVMVTGEDREPYYGELSLADLEKEDSRGKSYSVTGTYKGKENTYDISEEDWKMISDDSTIKGKISFGVFKLNMDEKE